MGLTMALGALGVAQAGMSIAGGYAASTEAKYNARVKEQQAQMITAQQGLEAYQWDRQMGNVAGTTRARTAKAGLTMSGSPMAVLLDTQTQMELDKAIGQYNLEAQKRFALSEADMYKTKAKTAKQMGYMQGFTQLLQTGAIMADRGLFNKNQFTANIAGKGEIGVAPPNYYLSRTKGL